jgi:hypothetical protein
MPIILGSLCMTHSLSLSWGHHQFLSILYRALYLYSLVRLECLPEEKPLGKCPDVIVGSVIVFSSSLFFFWGVIVVVLVVVVVVAVDIAVVVTAALLLMFVVVVVWMLLLVLLSVLMLLFWNITLFRSVAKGFRGETLPYRTTSVNLRNVQ